MKTREEQIEELAKAIYATGVALEGTDYALGVYDDDDHFHRMANALYAAGYRKQSEVIDAFVGKISAVALQMRYEASRAYQQGRSLSKAQFAFGEENAIVNLMEQINNLAKEYGAEVEK